MNYNVQQLQIDVIYTITKTRQFYDLEGESISVYNVFNRKLSHWNVYAFLNKYRT